MTPRSRLTAGWLAGVLSVLPHAALAQGFPNQPVRGVVTFPPGGAPDILSRLFADQAQLGPPVVVDNVPSAGANIGTDRIAKAPPDGYTVVMVMGTVGTHAINGALYSKMIDDSGANAD